MNAAPRFIVLHSSAGAGKTHALVRHYLSKCLDTDASDAYRHVLALTFTNKAAGEMRERVMTYLQGLAEGATGGAVASLRDELCQDLRLSEDVLRERAGRTMHHMVHHWGDVAIGTIDAFTRRVVQPFTRDLRLDHDLRMTTDEEHVRNEAVELLLAEAGNDPALTELLMAICEGLVEDEKAWRVDLPIRELSKELSKEEAVEHLAALRTLSERTFIELDRRLRRELRAFEEKVRAIGRTVLDTLEANGIHAEDMAHGKGGPHGYFTRLANAVEELPMPGANTLKPRSAGKWHSGKASKGAIATIAGLVPMFEDALDQVEALQAEARIQAVRRAVRRDLMPSATLHLLDNALEAYKRTQGIAFFSDLTRKVAGIVQEEPAPFLFERLGERYRHFLIDEFQDTSLLQWHCLLPLIENALSTDGMVLLVGDAKQAIYRWRNGEVRQFIQLPRIFGKERLPRGNELEAQLIQAEQKEAPLAHNRRSGRAIIALNNALFADLRQVLPETLRAAYEGHQQEPWKEEEGLVRFEPLGEKSEETVAYVEMAHRFVQEALADGYPAGDIAVLVRTTRQGAAIAEHLVANGMAVVSPDGLRIGGDPATRLVISVLHYLRHRDAAQAAQALQLLALLNAGDAAADPFDPIDGRMPKVAERMDAWLADHPGIDPQAPLTELIGQVAKAIGCDPASDAFLLFLLDEAHAHATSEGPDVAAFLEHWERSGSERAVELTNDATAVRILTVHKAKGLQYPVTIVPTTAMNGRGNKLTRIWVHPGEAVPELPSALVSMRKEIEAAELPEVNEERELALFDQLNMLYVAFTRPVERLYVGVDTKAKDPITTALLAHLGPAHADGGWTFGQRERARDRGAQPPMEHLPVAPREGWRGRLALRRQAPEGWDPAEPARDRVHGNLVHALLAEMKDVGDLQAAIMRATRLGDLDATDGARLQQQLEALLRTPGLDLYFAPGTEARIETDIITREGHTARPDRIVLLPDATRVLDIKTGRPSDTHHEQVRGYMRLLRELGLPGVSGHLLYTRTGELVPVTP
ncbi:MAG: UvrD-helicase domain-containing protein [Flavobacteriales bacterium]|nr:UvrD-helicase domain-containing protein [Flavobacteriales bacterium]